jgi:hypothetical protein
LRGRKGGRGKQHETKVCHGGVNPRNVPGNCLAIKNKALGRIVAACKADLDIFLTAQCSETLLFMVYSAITAKRLFTSCPAAYPPHQY